MAGPLVSIRQSCLSIVTVLLFTANDNLTAQTHEAAFGILRPVPLDKAYDGSILIPSRSGKSIMLAAYSHRERSILLAEFDPSLKATSFRSTHAPVNFENIYAADLNDDGKTDLLLVDREEKLLNIITDISKDSLSVSYSIRTDIDPENILLADCNNDRRTDLLVYTRKVPGILPLIAKGRGLFSPGTVIAQENLIGAADCAQINNDNLLDLIVLDWVKSEIHVLYGVGRGRFLDQSTFPVEREAARMLIGHVYGKHSIDIVLEMKEPSELQIWEGSGFGDFQVRNRIPFEGIVRDFELADVNNDGLNDVIAVVNPPALQVVFNAEVNTFTDRIEYACGNEPRSVIVPSKQRTKARDCIVLDREGKQFLIYKNIMTEDSFADSVCLVTGVYPTELVAADFNCDNINDIALLNKKSKSMSLYFGQKFLHPFGPYSYSLINEPDQLMFHSSTDTSLQMVITFSGASQISYFTLDAANNTVSNAFIGSEGKTQLMEAMTDEGNRVGFLVMNSTPAGSKYLSYYRQIGPVTFIERTFRLMPPVTLLGACAARINKDEYPDIVYVYRNADSSGAIGIAFGDPDYSMSKRIVTKRFRFPVSSSVLLWSDDLDSDGNADLLMQSDQKRDCLMLARGMGRGKFSDFIELRCGVQIEKYSSVQIVDVNRDRMDDIVIGSGKTGEIVWLRNRGKCVFDSCRTLLAEPDLYHYIISDINADSFNDIIMTKGKKGILKIINGRSIMPDGKAFGK